MDRFKIKLENSNTTLLSFKEKVGKQLNTTPDCISAIFRGEILKEDNKPLHEQWNGEGELCLICRKNKVDIPEKPMKQKPVVDINSCIENDIVKATIKPSSCQSTSAVSASDDSPCKTVIPKDSAPSLDLKQASNSQLSSGHTGFQDNFERLERKIDNLSMGLQHITDVLQKFASCKSCMKGLLKVIKTTTSIGTKTPTASQSPSVTPETPSTAATPEANADMIHQRPKILKTTSSRSSLSSSEQSEKK